MIHGIRNYLRVLGCGGLLSAIESKVTQSTVYFKLKRGDCQHPFKLRIPSSDVSTYQQVFLNKEYEFFANTEPRVIIDAGANIGLASIYFANKYPKARIIAVEPESNNFELLRDNVAAYANVSAVQAALWNKNEEINLVDPGLGNWGFMTESKQSPESLLRNTCHTVSAMTLDKIIDDYSLAEVNVLKVDIEGAEREVFSDTSAWIEKIDSIIIELHEHLKTGCNRNFYCGSRGFNEEWKKGENIYLSRGNIKPSV